MVELLNAILPNGKGTLLVYRLFSDESVDQERNFLTVAGYLIGSHQLARLEVAWANALGEELEFLHMCDGHATSHPEVFSKLSDLFTADHFMHGFAVSVHLPSTDEILSRHIPQIGRDTTQSAGYWFGCPETLCTIQLAYLANNWLDQTNPNEENVAYVHEFGGESCGEMAMYGNKLRKAREAGIEPLASEGKALRLHSYTTADGKKRTQGALQAADFLAWTCNQAVVNKGFPPYCEKAFNGVEVTALRLDPLDVEATLEATANQSHFSGMMNRAKILR